MTETSPACARFCGVCEAPNKPCICPACCRKLIASDRSSYTTLVGRRDALAASVRDALNAQVCVVWKIDGSRKQAHLHSPNRSAPTSSRMHCKRCLMQLPMPATEQMPLMPNCNNVCTGWHTTAQLYCGYTPHANHSSPSDTQPYTFIIHIRRAHPSYTSIRSPCHPPHHVHSGAGS